MSWTTRFHGNTVVSAAGLAGSRLVPADILSTMVYEAVRQLLEKVTAFDPKTFHLHIDPEGDDWVMLTVSMDGIPREVE